MSELMKSTHPRVVTPTSWSWEFLTSSAGGKNDLHAGGDGSDVRDVIVFNISMVDSREKWLYNSKTDKHKNYNNNLLESVANCKYIILLFVCIQND